MRIPKPGWDAIGRSVVAPSRRLRLGQSRRHCVMCPDIETASEGRAWLQHARGRPLTGRPAADVDRARPCVMPPLQRRTMSSRSAAIVLVRTRYRFGASCSRLRADGRASHRTGPFAVDLFFDEAQYWSWSRDLAFGYFSKPPLLAWLIAAVTHVCGDAEICVRSPRRSVHLARALRPMRSAARFTIPAPDFGPRC